MQVGLFGSIGEQLGRELTVNEAGVATVSDLRRQLAKRFPATAELFTGSTLKACVADRMVDDDHQLADVQRVEFFPPLSGG